MLAQEREGTEGQDGKGDGFPEREECEVCPVFLHGLSSRAEGIHRAYRDEEARGYWKGFQAVVQQESLWATRKT